MVEGGGRGRRGGAAKGGGAVVEEGEKVAVHGGKEDVRLEEVRIGGNKKRVE